MVTHHHRQTVIKLSIQVRTISPNYISKIWLNKMKLINNLSRLKRIRIVISKQ